MRLDSSRNNKFFDAELSRKLGTTARQFIDAGLSALNYYVADFDAATDLFEMLRPVDDSVAFAKSDRNAAICFRHPLTFTELTTLCTFIAQILFGGEQARAVEARRDDQEDSADAINGLLAWNDSKLDIYEKGYLWVQDSLVYNRGIWFESSKQDVEINIEEVEEDDITKPQQPLENSDGSPKMRKGKQVVGYPKIKRQRKIRKYSGFYNHIDLVSPYDFVSDPTLPPGRFQEGRFAGHRVMIPWHELKRRSELDPSDDQYVLPETVKKIKTQKGSTMTPAALGGVQAGGPNTSRTFYDRNMRYASIGGIGSTIGAGLVGGADAVNKDDGGTVECFSMTIRVKPKTIGLYPDDEENELICLLITNQADLLSVNVLPNKHDEFPYCVGEARPNGHRQYSPGWALALKPVQDRVDELNNRHATAQKRMGNILLYDPAKCDISNILDPNKDGLLIQKTEQAGSTPNSEIVSQIKLEDTTAGYNEEIAMWQNQAEALSGAHAYVQGVTNNEDQTATQFTGTQEMATGRISSIARLLSEQALKPQTRRFVMNFQQFMPESQSIQILGKGSDFDPDNPPQKFMLVEKANIQCEFDVVPHDGSLPGAKAQKVAAASRAIEAAASNPVLAAAFDDTVPGNLSLVRIMRQMLKDTGMSVEKFSVTREQAMKNLQAKQLSMGMGVQAPLPGQAGPAAPNLVPTGAGAVPGGESIPATPQAVTP